MNKFNNTDKYDNRFNNTDKYNNINMYDNTAVTDITDIRYRKRIVVISNLPRLGSLHGDLRR